MRAAWGLVGLGALAAITIAASFGAAGSGAVAQDQAEQDMLETANNEIQMGLDWCLY